MGLIYCVRNKINNKIYIGQTKKTLKNRWQHHLSQVNDGTYFHNAILKYGVENFEYFVLEDNVSNDDIDAREVYWIKKKKSEWKYNKGYNLTRGGKTAANTNCILTPKDVLLIKEKILNTNMTFEEISKDFNVSLSAISDINNGRTWRDVVDGEYPLRHIKRKEFLIEDFLFTLDLLKSKFFSISHIAEILGISTSVISIVNCGKYTKFEYPKGYIFPISEQRVVTNTKYNNIELVAEILLMYIRGAKYSEISCFFNIEKGTIKGIIQNIMKKPCFVGVKNPLRDFREYNEFYILNLIKEYNTIKNRINEHIKG